MGAKGVCRGVLTSSAAVESLLCNVGRCHVVGSQTGKQEACPIKKDQCTMRLRRHSSPQCEWLVPKNSAKFKWLATPKFRVSKPCTHYGRFPLLWTGYNSIPISFSIVVIPLKGFSKTSLCQWQTTPLVMYNTLRLTQHNAPYAKMSVHIRSNAHSNIRGQPLIFNQSGSIYDPSRLSQESTDPEAA